MIIDVVITPGFWNTGEPGYNDIGLYDTAYNVIYPVLSINSSLLTATSYSSVITKLVYTDTIFGPLHDFIAEFDCLFYLIILR